MFRISFHVAIVSADLVAKVEVRALFFLVCVASSFILRAFPPWTVVMSLAAAARYVATGLLQHGRTVVAQGPLMRCHCMLQSRQTNALCFGSPKRASQRRLRVAK